MAGTKYGSLAPVFCCYQAISSSTLGWFSFLGGTLILGFNVYPEYLYTTNPPASGALSAGQYQYVAVYEWMDNEGNIHKSAPSPALTQNNGSFTFYGNQTSGGAVITSFSKLPSVYSY